MTLSKCSKVVVIGGSGLIGSRVVSNLQAQGYSNVISASRKSGVDLITQQGLVDSVKGAVVVVDLSQAPSFEESFIKDFFKSGTTNLLNAEHQANSVQHHILLSIVGVDRVEGAGYFEAKLNQEKILQNQFEIPYTIIRATQFFEFLNGLAHGSYDAKTDKIRLSTKAFIQPISADDTAAIVTQAVIDHKPINGIRDVAGPAKFPLHQIVKRYLTDINDLPNSEKVVPDDSVGWFGCTSVHEKSLVPEGKDTDYIANTSYEDWIAQHNKK